MSALTSLEPAAIIGELCRRDFKRFVSEFWPIVEPTTPLVWNWHHDCLVDHLTNIKAIRNLLINCPPGLSKSLFLCVFFFCWRWLNDPSERFLYASYSLKLSERDSLKCRRLIESPKFQAYFPARILFNEDQNTKLYYENTATGFRQAVATSGLATGLKGQYCILDDPHAAQDADSETAIDGTINWFCDVWYNRLCDFSKDCRIVIGQRVRKGDLSEYIANNYSDWTHIVLPWEYRPTTYVTPIGWSDPRKQPGEPLWPERFPASEIQNLKRRPTSFAAQWNQAPADSTAALFHVENFKYYSETEDAYQLGDRIIPKDICFTVASCDPALSEKGGDYTAITIADVSAYGDIIVRDVIRERMSAVKLLPRLQKVDATYNPEFLLIENNGVGVAVFQLTRASDLGAKVRPVKTKRGVTDSEDIKVVRSLDLQIAFENHQVWFPLGAPWLAAAEQELIDFPNGQHDDIVDATAHLVTFAKRRTRGNRPEEDKPKELTDDERNRLFWERVWAE